ncbi:MAG: FAD binding domain-containing protein, partial [Mycobacterium sp.]
ELSYVRRGDDGLHIGSLTTHHTVEHDCHHQTAQGFTVITDAMRWVGHLPIRVRGTIGGSIAHGDATAEWCLLAVLLGADIVVRSIRGRRTIPAEEFFLGYYSTALEFDELITEVHFPTSSPHASLTEYAQRHGDFALAAAAAKLVIEDGAVVDGRVVLGGIAPVPVVADAANTMLRVERPLTAGDVAACADAVADSLILEDALQVDVSYMRGLVRHLVMQALRQAAGGLEMVRS